MTVALKENRFPRTALLRAGGCLIAVVVVSITLYGIRISSPSPLFNAFVAVKCVTTWARPQTRLAFPGSGDWLFYRDGILAIVKPWKYARSNAETMAALNDTLRGKGIKLFIMPIPDKEAIIQNYSLFKVGKASNQRTRTIAMLRKRNVDVIDLEPSFIAKISRDSLYQKRDGHWDGPGIVMAAGQVSDSINRYLGGNGESRYSFKDTCIFEPRDLAELLGDSSLYPRACRIIADKSGEPFRDSAWSDIMIIGDSYTMVNRAFGGGIGAQIAYFTNRPTFTMGHIGAFARWPAEVLSFLKNRRKLPKVIVWAFVSRSFLNKIEPF
jgi:hypothetical protein